MLNLMEDPVIETPSVFKRFRNYISSASYSRTIGIIGLLIVIAAIPLTVFISQKQQEIRQRASSSCNYAYGSESSCNRNCPPSLGKVCVKSPTSLSWWGCCDMSTTTTSTTTTTSNAGTTNNTKNSCITLGPKYNCVPTDQCPDGHSFIDTSGGSLPGCSSGTVCCDINTTTTTTAVKTKSCHECSSTKYCGAQTWEQPDGTTCSKTYSNRTNIQYNQVVCSCSTGTAGTCEGLSKENIASQCDPTAGTKCSRCSDVYKYCSVEYDKNTDGSCGNGDNAKNKVYSVNCTKCASIGDDKGYCPSPNGGSTSSCSAPSTSPLTYSCSTTTGCYVDDEGPYFGGTSEQNLNKCNNACITTTTTTTSSTTTIVTTTTRPNTTTSSTTPPKTGDTILAFDIGFDGIGTVGDNLNPDAKDSTKNPLHPVRNLLVSVFDRSNQIKIDKKQTQLVYASSSGRFTGSVNLGSFTSDDYTVKIKSDGFLRRLIPGIQNIKPGSNTMAQVNLVNGDINNDNAINILDYNIFISCSNFTSVGSRNPALCNSNPDFKTRSDLYDDGTIDKFDYNLFLREFSVQNGD